MFILSGTKGPLLGPSKMNMFIISITLVRAGLAWAGLALPELAIPGGCLGSLGALQWIPRRSSGILGNPQGFVEHPWEIAGDPMMNK